MKAYKVKHTPTGLFWKGGGIPNYMSYLLSTLSKEEVVNKVIDMKFSSKGKTWNQLNHVKSAITYQKESSLFSEILEDCEIITYILIAE